MHGMLIFIMDSPMYRKSSSNTTLIAIIALLLAIIAYILFSRQPSAVISPTLSKDDVQAVVKDYINNNPEAIIASVQAMQERKSQEDQENSKKLLESKKSELEDRSSFPIAGNPNGDVTIVEFFDYRCGYCKRLMPTLNQLLSEDKNIAIVMREFPILGPGSQKAAEVALATYAIDKEKYLKLHDILMAAPDLNNEDAIIEKATALGIDKARLLEEMEKPSIAETIQKNHELATLIGIRGTPAFVINGELIPGSIDLATFREKIAEARAAKAKASAN